MKDRWKIPVAGIMVLMIVAICWMGTGRGGAVPQPQLISTHLLTIERIEELSALTTLKVEVADAQVTEIRGRTGGIKAVLVVRGDVTIGVDLSAAHFGDVDELKRTATLTLPEPRVQSVRLDHEKTRLIGVWPEGLWEIVPGGQEADTAAVNLAYRDAERALTAAAQNPELIERSGKQAQVVLRVCFAALGWEVAIKRPR
ncbi:MAG TPA: DUF4230 domain-containing protein [Tepidisphaeraceae bacterium]